MTVTARRGIALLEALVALALLGILGVSLLAAVTEATRPLELARESERRVLEASRLLDAVSLWPAPELDARLGGRTQGPFVLHVARLQPTLYEVVVQDTLTRTSLLSTRLLRIPGP